MSTGTYQRGNGQRANGHGRESEVIDNDNITFDLQAQPGFTELQVKGEVDVQISTAKRYPRNMRQFLAKAESMATIDEETASGCFYRLPARKSKDGEESKPIEGPSVRFAEIIAATWGNLRVQAQIVDDKDGFITAQGRCWDLENNVAVAVDVRRKITTKDGRRFSDDMINVTANAACGIAFRNSVMKVVPLSVSRSVYLKARQVAIGDASTLEARRANAVDYFAKMGVNVQQLCAAVGKASIVDITVDDIATLVGLKTAIREGELSVDEAFPKAEKKVPEKQPDSANSKSQEPNPSPEAKTDSQTKQAEPQKPQTSDQSEDAILTIDDWIKKIHDANSRLELSAVQKLVREEHTKTPFDSADYDRLSVEIQEQRKQLR